MASIEEEASQLSAESTAVAVEVSAAEAEAAPVAAPVTAPTAASATSGGKWSKRNKKAAAAAAKEEEESANNIATVDHPYLSFLHKRIRSYKKKLEKIRGLELARSNDGKVLNPQQLELVGSKPVLEKLVVEFETLREQFIEVYLQEEAAKKAMEEEKAAALIDVVLEATTPELESAQEPHAVEAPRDEFAHVEELLKTLHVVTLHQALGKDVPMVLDFFSKVLLGNTRPPAELSYEENLTESLEEAKKYLGNSNELFACDMSYAGLREIVDELDKSAAAPAIEAVEAEEAPTEQERTEELPQINFFTDSQLEPEEITSAEIDEPSDDKVTEQVEPEEVITEVTMDTITIEEAVTIDPIKPARVIVEPPLPPSALPIPSPPKSFAAVTSGGSVSPSGSNRSPSPSANDARGKSGSQRRRGGGRWKKENSNSSSSNGSGGKGDGSDEAKPNKPRRPRPNRGNDEKAGDQPANRGGFKDKDRRPRADYSFRKQNSPRPHEPAPIAPNA